MLGTPLWLRAKTKIDEDAGVELDTEYPEVVPFALTLQDVELLRELPRNPVDLTPALRLLVALFLAKNDPVFEKR